MKFASTLALAITLVGAPALAAKKEKAAEATASSFKPQLGAGFRKAAGPVQTALAAKDVAAAQTALAALAPTAQTPDEKFYLAQFKLNLAAITKDPKAQAAAVDEVLASGSAGASETPGKFQYFSGLFAYQGSDYAKAAQRLQEAQAAGYKADDLNIMLADASFRTNNSVQGMAAADRAFAEKKAAGQPVPDSWYKVVVAATYKGKDYANTSRYMRQLVAAYPTPGNWRDALVLYRDSAKLDPALAIDVFRLMRAAKALDGERDYYEYALYADQRGLPGEAKAVIDEGRALGKAPKSSTALNEVYSGAVAKIPADRASLAKSDAASNAAANGRVAANTGDAHLAYGEDDKAAELYRTALAKGGVDADAVNTRLGIALARQGKVAEAKAAFAQVKGPRADIASYWVTWLDQKPAA